MNRVRGLFYFGVGVDIDVGNFLVNVIKFLVVFIVCIGCIVDFGGFGGFFDFKVVGYLDLLFVSGIDGVGIKFKVRIIEIFIKREKKEL